LTIFKKSSNKANALGRQKAPLFASGDLQRYVTKTQ
jgi:hypothetical protein